MPTAPAPPWDENALPGLESRAIKQSLPGRQRADRHRRRFRVAEKPWFRGDARRVREAIFRRRALGKPVIHPIDLLTDLDASDSVTDRRDHAGKFMTGDGIVAGLTGFHVRGRIPE